jgi:hypothetical protein
MDLLYLVYFGNNEPLVRITGHTNLKKEKPHFIYFSALMMADFTFSSFSIARAASSAT